MGNFDKIVRVVIGANFGDEGKGLMTDYFVSQALDEGRKPLVIRFNGGAQAAHTVVTPEGLEHVFSHFGSGTLQGVPTYLSQFFISNPTMFVKEHRVLCKKLKGKIPLIYVHPDSIVTTPVDVWINQAVERARGDARHGSCGLGISETVVRNEHPLTKVHLRVRDLLNHNELRAKLKFLVYDYMPMRLSELGYPKLHHEFLSLDVNLLFNNFLDDVQFFLDHVLITTDKALFEHFDALIFEGAQGLLLDQDLEEFAPHITHSKTGLINVLKIIAGSEGWLRSLQYPVASNETGVIMEVCYVTRAYLTRHGAGRMDTELPEKPYRGIHDPTNLPNEWQGSLRFGYLDLDQLNFYVLLDKLQGESFKFYLSVAVTCMDQIDPVCYAVRNGKLEQHTKESLLDVISSTSLFARMYSSWGRTRETVLDSFQLSLL